MRKLTLTLSAAALAFVGGSAVMAMPGMGKKADTDGDGVVTLAEMTAHAGQRFERMDANGDGTVDGADREARKAARQARLDTDGNGEVSDAEKAAAREARQQRRAERTERRAERTERRAERTGEPAEANGERRGKHRGMRGMFAGIDANQDKALTRAEFDAAVAAHFAKADTDGNGSVTAEERRAARQATRAARQAES